MGIEMRMASLSCRLLKYRQAIARINELSCLVDERQSILLGKSHNHLIGYVRTPANTRSTSGECGTWVMNYCFATWYEHSSKFSEIASDVNWGNMDKYIIGPNCIYRAIRNVYRCTIADVKGDVRICSKSFFTQLN